MANKDKKKKYVLTRQGKALNKHLRLIMGITLQQ
jgi:hypothetical protein